MIRRRLLSTTVLATSAAVLAACAPTPAPVSGVPVTPPTPAVQRVVFEVQYLLPLLKVLVLGMGIAVPTSAVFVNAALPYLDQAAAAFQLLQATMPVSTAQPIAQQVVGYLKEATDTLATVVASAGAGSKLSQYGPEVAEAQAVLALITAFANGVQAMPMARAQTSLPYLHR